MPPESLLLSSAPRETVTPELLESNQKTREQTCANCVHFFPTGECRAKPPQMVPLIQPHPVTNAPQVGSVGIFPPTDPSWWCGEHKHRDYVNHPSQG